MTPAQHETLASAAEAAGWPREEITVRVEERPAQHGCPADYVAVVRRWEIDRTVTRVRATGPTADAACEAVATILRGVSA